MKFLVDAQLPAAWPGASRPPVTTPRTPQGCPLATGRATSILALAAATGGGVKEIMYRVGHSSPRAALQYQHASARRDLLIAEGISELIRRERDPDLQ